MLRTVALHAAQRRGAVDALADHEAAVDEGERLAGPQRTGAFIRRGELVGVLGARTAVTNTVNRSKSYSLRATSGTRSLVTTLENRTWAPWDQFLGSRDQRRGKRSREI